MLLKKIWILSAYEERANRFVPTIFSAFPLIQMSLGSRMVKAAEQTPLVSRSDAQTIPCCQEKGCGKLYEYRPLDNIVSPLF